MTSNPPKIQGRIRGAISFREDRGTSATTSFVAQLLYDILVKIRKGRPDGHRR